MRHDTKNSCLLHHLRSAAPAAPCDTLTDNTGFHQLHYTSCRHYVAPYVLCVDGVLGPVRTGHRAPQ